MSIKRSYGQKMEASSTTTDSLSGGSYQEFQKDQQHETNEMSPSPVRMCFKKKLSPDNSEQSPYQANCLRQSNYSPQIERIKSFLNPEEEDVVMVNQENNPKGVNWTSQSRLLLNQSPKKKGQPVRPNQILSDRFVPCRRSSKFQQSEQQQQQQQQQQQMNGEQQQNGLEHLYKQQILQQEELGDSLKYSNLNSLHYNNALYYLDQLHPNNKNSPLVENKYFTIQNYQGQFGRKIAKTPYKVLDAPALQDDFYLNLIDWSSQNILSVALSSCVYLWSAQTSKVTKLLDLGSSDQVTSVAWSLQGPHMAVGTNTGEVQIWDAEKLKKVRVLKGHLSRVGTLCFSQSLLSSGSRDKQILQRDLRSPSQYLWKQSAHRQEVCGLKWSPDSQLLASGGNDNKLYVWSAHSATQPVYKFNDHQAAVKAIAWSPHQHGLLASGGGTADRTIRFWNALEGKNIGKEDTGSQVCNLLFSKCENEIISTHGYSQNQIVIWKVGGMKRVATLTGHTFRVLYLAMSPDGQTIVTGAGDETLRFWNIYAQKEQQLQTIQQGSALHPNNVFIR